MLPHETKADAQLAAEIGDAVKVHDAADATRKEKAIIVGKLLVEARKRHLTTKAFEKFLETVPRDAGGAGIGIRRAETFIAFALDRKAFEEHQKENAAAQQRFRDKQKAEKIEREKAKAEAEARGAGEHDVRAVREIVREVMANAKLGKNVVMDIFHTFGGGIRRLQDARTQDLEPIYAACKRALAGQPPEPRPATEAGGEPHALRNAETKNEAAIKAEAEREKRKADQERCLRLSRQGRLRSAVQTIMDLIPSRADLENPEIKIEPEKLFEAARFLTALAEEASNAAIKKAA